MIVALDMNRKKITSETYLNASGKTRSFDRKTKRLEIMKLKVPAMSLPPVDAVMTLSVNL